jgi:hypothetical protein
MKLLFTKYFKIINLYYKFFILEIPNFIQILSLLTFFTILLQNNVHRLVLIWIVSLFLGLYLIEKSFLFLKDQIVDTFSEINRHKLEDKYILKWWTFFSIITMMGFALLANYLSKIIILF